MTNENMFLRYSVKPMRDAGLEAKWTHTNRGKPIIIARNPNCTSEHGNDKWYYVTNDMFELMRENGIREGFNMSTVFGDIFFL